MLSPEHPDMFHQAIHEITIMADNDQAAREIQEKFFQNLQAVYVEIIGRLVQDQKIGIGHQYLQQMQSLFFATTEQ